MNRTGVSVFIAWDDYRRVYTVHSEARDPQRFLEQGPDFSDAASAVEWGRARADRVLIRPAYDGSRYFWAGIGKPTTEDIEIYPDLVNWNPEGSN